MDALDAKDAGVVAHADDASIEGHEPGVAIGAESGVGRGDGERMQVNGVHSNEATIHKKCHAAGRGRRQPQRGVSRLKSDLLPDEAAFSAQVLRG